MYNVIETFHTEAFSASREISARVLFNDNVEVDGTHLQDMTVEEVVSADKLTIGSTCSSKATVKMFMPDPVIPLTNGWMNLYVSIPTECPLGKFYIADVVTKDKYKTVTITAYDKMWHLNKAYEPNISFPASIRSVVMDIAGQNDFEVDFDSFPDYEITLVEATEREMIGYCAGLMGKNAKFNRDGKLTFVWFTDTDRDIPLEVQYQGGFSETTMDSFVLGGLVSGTSENPLTAGSGRTITFSNPFMTQEILDSILAEVAGFTYTPCEVKYRCDPSFETGDIVDVVDDDTDVTAVYPVPIMAQKIKVGGGLNATIYAYGKSEESDTLITAPSDGKIDRVKGELEKHLETLTGNIVGKNGGYYHITYDEQGFPNGWEIMHDPVLTPTTKMWIMSKGGLGFSSDGGQTVDYAFDMEGNFNASFIMGNSIKADMIDTDDVFAQKVAATNLTISGNSVFEDAMTIKYAGGTASLSLIETSIGDGNGLDFINGGITQSGGLKIAPIFVISADNGLKVDGGIGTSSLSFTNAHGTKLSASKAVFGNLYTRDETLVGTLTLNKSISYALASRTGTPFHVWDGDANGMGVRIGDGGTVVIGSGESASNLISNMNIAASTEHMYLASDNEIYFYTSCNAIANKVNPLTLTGGGAKVNGTLTVNGTAVSLSGHTHDYMPSSKFVTGTYVYNGASTTSFSFTNSAVSGKGLVICGTQDAGNVVQRASISGSTITVQFATAVSVARINYICF